MRRRFWYIVGDILLAMPNTLHGRPGVRMPLVSPDVFPLWFSYTDYGFVP
jgi:hypothetical protein